MRMCRSAAFTLLTVGLTLALLASAQDGTLREAARLDADGKCSEAERYYQVALAKEAPSPALLNNLGNHYFLCGKLDKAELYFRRLTKLNPAHANANLQLARIATDRKQGDKALEYLARLPDADPAARLLRAE